MTTIFHDVSGFASLDGVWSIRQESLEQVVWMLRSFALRDVAAGPVDDAQQNGLPVFRSGSAAVIPIMGPIVKRGGFISLLFGLASSQSIQRAVEAAAADESVDLIVLSVDSPGGQVDGLAELSDAVMAAREQKTVIAQVAGMAASAAFMIASQANLIFAGRMDLIGSIGTRMMLLDFSELFEKEGIKAIPIDTGKFKSAGAMGTKITNDQIAEFQRIVDGFFEDFIGAVVRGRKLPEARVRDAADGRVFFARQAVSMGLIDGIQSLEDTLSGVRGRSGTARRRRRPAARIN